MQPLLATDSSRWRVYGAVLLLTLPLQSFAEKLAPYFRSCDQPEVIIPKVTTSQVLDELVSRAKANGGTVLVSDDKTFVVEQALREPIVSHVATGDQTFVRAQLRFDLDEARLGVRVSGTLGLVGHSPSEPELVVNAYGDRRNLAPVLARLASKFPSGRTSFEITPVDFDSVAETVINEIESGGPKLIYILSERTPLQARNAMSKRRSVVELAELRKSSPTGVPRGYGRLDAFQVEGNDATVKVLVGPTEGGRYVCGSAFTIQLKSQRAGWAICERSESVC